MKEWIKASAGRLLATGFLLAIMAGGSWLIRERRNLKSLSMVPAAFYAKEMCSCVFVMGRENFFCDAYVRTFVPVNDISVDRVRGTVEASALWRTARAKYLSKRFGCVLERSANTVTK